VQHKLIEHCAQRFVKRTSKDGKGLIRTEKD